MAACFIIDAGAQIIDRIAVTVGKHVITEQDVLTDLRVVAFLDQKAPDFSSEQKRKAADRLVDQYLVAQEAAASHLTLAIASDAEKLLAQTKAQFASEEAYRDALSAAGVTEAEVLAHLLAGLRTMRFTDLRFRPEIQLSEEDMRDFYDTLSSSQKKDSKDAMPSYDESRSQVEKLLTDQRVIQAFDRWLGGVRTETQILYKDAVFK